MSNAAKMMMVMVMVRVMMMMMMMIIIIIIIMQIVCVHNYTSTYARRKKGYNWTKNTGMNMCQNQ